MRTWSCSRVSPAMVAAALLLVWSTPAMHGCGGCPWLHSSAVFVDPATPCLELSIADTTGEGDSTGCVDPVLHGWNRCTAPLTLPASFADSGVEQTFAPGARVVFEVSLGASTPYESDTSRFTMPARLGADDVTIRFSVW